MFKAYSEKNLKNDEIVISKKNGPPQQATLKTFPRCALGLYHLIEGGTIWRKFAIFKWENSIWLAFVYKRFRAARAAFIIL